MDTKQTNRWTKNDVVTALRRKEFVPYFQPQIDLNTGVSTCVEILARWDHPELGILPPSQFIGLIESAGLIDQFTDNLFRQSLENAATYAVQGRAVGMAVNFSWLALQDPQVPLRICSLVKEHGISFDQITIEVTESALPENLSSVVRSLTVLRSNGFKISIDDFGTGYSSLKLLSKIPFTELKIDQIFIGGIAIDWKLTSILESIVQMAEKLKLSTVAEGIENKMQADFVRTLGCNIGQGFYFGGPVRDL